MCKIVFVKSVIIDKITIKTTNATVAATATTKVWMRTVYYQNDYVKIKRSTKE